MDDAILAAMESKVMYVRMHKQDPLLCSPGLHPTWYEYVLGGFGAPSHATLLSQSFHSSSAQLWKTCFPSPANASQEGIAEPALFQTAHRVTCTTTLVRFRTT